MTDSTPSLIDTVPSPQVPWREHLRRLPRDVVTSGRAIAGGARFLLEAVRDDRARGEWHPDLYRSLLRHDLGDRALEPWRWVACGLLPRAVVYRVALHAIARAVDGDEVVPQVPAMEVVARWGGARERTAAAKRRYRDQPEKTVLHDDGSVSLAAGDAAWLNVLLDAAVPREADGPMDWEGRGRAHAKEMLGYDEHGSVLGVAHPRNQPDAGEDG